jgi:hypothetical protein
MHHQKEEKKDEVDGTQRAEWKQIDEGVGVDLVPTNKKPSSGLESSFFGALANTVSSRQKAVAQFHE